jgi:hypothetical protein
MILPSSGLLPIGNWPFSQLYDWSADLAGFQMANFKFWLRQFGFEHLVNQFEIP